MSRISWFRVAAWSVGGMAVFGVCACVVLACEREYHATAGVRMRWIEVPLRVVPPRPLGPGEDEAGAAAADRDVPADVGEEQPR